jgi:hypothetical protein
MYLLCPPHGSISRERRSTGFRASRNILLISIHRRICKRASNNPQMRFGATLEIGVHAI